ncbi:MAG TPA: AAA family ATPase, partial [Dermatophilaceae bacterium]|nr:AAA family ATPase [Dermatophilaceae bacterium]
NTVIIMTTNLGTRDITKGSLGFSAGPDSRSEYERMKNKVTDELKNHFRPGEFVLVDATGDEKDSTFTFTGSLRRDTIPDIPDVPPVDTVGGPQDAPASASGS